jgi:hypothetical protein
MILGMNRFRCLFFLPLVLLVTGCAVFTGSERHSWFPLRVGNEWDYALVSTMGQDGRLDTTTTGVYRHAITGLGRLADGRPAFVRVWNSEVTLRDSGMADSSFSQSETTYFRRTKRWVYRYLTPASPPDSILQLPPELDQKWRSEGVSYWVAAREDVNAGGRLYPRCWRLTTTEGNDASSSNAWFAPGFGLIRMATERTFGTKKLRTDYFLTAAKIK